MKTSSILARALGAAALICATLSNAQASLLGDMVRSEHRAPNVFSIINQLGPVAVGPGVEFPVARPTASNFFDSIDLSANKIRIAASYPPGGFTPIPNHPFYGWQLVNDSQPWPEFTPTATLPNFDASDVTVNGQVLLINLSGVTLYDGDFIELTAVPVSAPAALPLMLAGLAALGAIHRRRRAA